MHHATQALISEHSVNTSPRSVRRLAVVTALALWLSACSTTRVNGPAPVEDRQTLPRPLVAVPGNMPAAVQAGTPAVGVSEYAGKAGYYTVKPGDSLIRIGLEVGQPWRDLARWNNLENPNKLEAGQVLRVASTVPLPVAGSLVPEPVSGPVAQGTPPVGSSTAPVKSGVVTAQPLAPATVSPATPAVTAKTGDDDMAFVWPAGGSVIAGFDEQKNKGLGISGKPGDAVLACVVTATS